MVQIVEPGRNKLGEQLNEVLMGLAQTKYAEHKQKQQKQQQASGLATLLGIPIEKASQIVHAPEAALKEYSKAEFARPGNEAFGRALQSIAGGGQGDVTIPPGPYNAKQALELTKLATEAKDKKLQAQRHYENLANKDFNKIEERSELVSRYHDLARQALEIVNNETLKTGFAGKFTPTWLQSDAAQRFEALIKQMVIAKASSSKGILSVAKLKLEEAGKPNLAQSPATIKALLNKILKNKDDLKILSANKAREEIQSRGISKDWKDDLKTLTNKYFKEYHKAGKTKKKTKTSQNEFNELPPAAQFAGRIIKNPETGQRLQSVNGEWVPMGEGL